MVLAATGSIDSRPGMPLWLADAHRCGNPTWIQLSEKLIVRKRTKSSSAGALSVVIRGPASRAEEAGSGCRRARRGAQRSRAEQSSLLSSPFPAASWEHWHERITSRPGLHFYRFSEKSTYLGERIKCVLNGNLGWYSRICIQRC